MQRNAAAFIASLPALAHSLDNSALARALTRATLAARLNAYLPASVWRKNKQTALYDTEQPRDKYGRWTADGITLPAHAKQNASALFQSYRGKNAKTLAHDGLPAPATITKASIIHCKNTRTKYIRDAIFNTPAILRKLFHSGFMREKKVAYTRKGKTDKNKIDWARCWSISGKQKIKLGNSARRKYHYEFTVFQRHSGEVEIYDFSIK